jgi:hypothetical protein
VSHWNCWKQLLSVEGVHGWNSPRSQQVCAGIFLASQSYYKKKDREIRWPTSHQKWYCIALQARDGETVAIIGFGHSVRGNSTPIID